MGRNSASAVEDVAGWAEGRLRFEGGTLVDEGRAVVVGGAAAEWRCSWTGDGRSVCV